ncbi:MAG TPA: SOS response-associated peptidase [Methanomicrobiales archaeon]|jgi:putative SOS response-associated peptidase YedK|nr:SOS response-associated peptidase [Methanomicrobiales archaeon]
MCGRFTIVPTVDFHERFGLPAGPAIAPRYNVAPGQEFPVIVRGDGNRLVPMAWGFIAPFVRDTAAGRPIINARAETLLERPSFRDAVQEHRCLVPASGFYEWKKEGRRKIPFYIRLTGEPLFAFAGLYSTLRDIAGGEHRTFAIITTGPNRLVAGLHDRMPAILPVEREETWLRQGPVGPADLASLLSPYPASEMEAFPVSGAVNDPAKDGPELVRPLSGLEK